MLILRATETPKGTKNNSQMPLKRDQKASTLQTSGVQAGFSKEYLSQGHYFWQAQETWILHDDFSSGRNT